MELNGNLFQFDSFMTATLGIIVLFVGKRLNEFVGVLREFSIPEPVTGGLLFSILFSLLYLATGIETEFELEWRDTLLVYFFTTIGLNASLRDLVTGGKPLLILLLITIIYMVLQNLTGISVATAFDLDAAVGILGGTISLIGGHGTAIAWAPNVAENYGIINAMEIGIASATFGLILASLMGGPIAKYLIKKHNLKASHEEPQDIGAAEDETDKHQGIHYLEFLDAILSIHLAIILGWIMRDAISGMGLQLPLFVTCLFAGILFTNFRPSRLPRLTGLRNPSRSPAMALIAEISLGAFLAMSLMSMQLWALADLAGPIFAILLAQFLVAILVNLYIVFPAMGKTYDAAVISAGFGGISLGSTPTAMANMSAVANRYGASHMAFIVVPLVCAFFIDIVNALLIPLFLANS